MKAGTRFFVNDMGDFIPVAAITEQCAEEVTGRAKKRILSGPWGDGRIYSAYWRAGNYQASAPGYPPRNNTGTLTGHIGHSEAREVEKNVWASDMGSNALSRGKPYPAYLESGTRNMDPRPVWMQVLDAAKKAIMNIVKKYAMRKPARA